MALPPEDTPRADLKDCQSRSSRDHTTYMDQSFRDVQRDIFPPTPSLPVPSTYTAIMYNGHFLLATTHHHPGTDTWTVTGTASFLGANYPPPPQHAPGPATYATETGPTKRAISGT